jgi:adenosylcobinamide-GDP ribazoletransferase
MALDGSRQQETIMRSLLQAISLLTRIPVRVAWDDNRPLGRILVWAPVVGLLIGGLLFAAAWGLSIALPMATASLLAPALLLVLWVMVTGGLHLDGWCDCCDGLFVPASREKRLEIMKDPRTGSFGVIGAVLLLLVKFAAIQAVLAMNARQAPAGWLPLVLAPAMARATMVFAAGWLPLARPGGMGAKFREGLGAAQLVAVAGILAMVLLGAAFLATHWSLGLACCLAAILAAAAWSVLAMRRLDGLTGDVYGGIVELAETAALVAAVAVLAHG